MLTFRTPTREEYGRIALLVNEAEKIFATVQSPEEREGQVHESLELLCEGEGRRVYLCAYEEGEMVGFASFRLKNPLTLWVSQLFIHVSAQQRGYGGALLRRVEELGRDLGARVIALETAQQAFWAVDFYKKQGYHILSDEDLLQEPFHRVLDKKQVMGRYVFGKLL